MATMAIAAISVMEAASKIISPKMIEFI